MSMANPSRRVTRSQSRERDEIITTKQLLSQNNQRVAPHGQTQSKNLSPVIERSPFQTPQAGASRLSSSVVPDTPAHDEGHTDFSGTTFLAQDPNHGLNLDSARSVDVRVDAIDLADELPDLQQASTRLLEIFDINSSDAKNICKAAKRVNQPGHEDYKRLKRVSQKLTDSMEIFTKGGYIDVASISQLIPSVAVEDASEPWEAAPYLYRANYAWLLLSTLSATVGSQDQAQLVEDLDKHFPASFLSRLVRTEQKMSGGSSRARSFTIDLAVEIRTQHLILQLERRKDEKGFDASSVLKEIFYRVPSSSQPPHSTLDPGMLRGFNLPGTFQDQNGCLPDNLHEDVLLRIDDLETSLFDAEDNLDLSGLKKSFSWARFCLRVARFVQRREQEFKDVVASHPRIDDVQDLLIKAIKRQRRPNMAETPSRSILADSVYDSPSITLNATPQERPRAQEKGSKTPLNEMTGSREADRTALSPHVATPRSDPKPTTSELKGANRRKSGKGIWRNPDGMDMLSFLAKNIQSGRQAEKAPSQPPPTRTPQGEHSARPESPLGLGITADKDEIAGTPEPELEPEPASHQPVSTQRPETSRQRPESSHSKDEHTLHRSYYDFEISQPNQEDMSASPRGSERINRVSHRPSPFFASPSVVRGKQAWPHRSLLDPQPTASKIFFSPGDSEEDSHLNQRHREPSKRPSTQNPPASQSHSRKRGRGDSDDDSSDDDDFDRDTRTHDVSARRAQISTRTHHGEKRQRLDVETQRGSVELLEATTASQSSPRSQQARSANQEASSTQPPRKESRWLAENSLPSTTDPSSLSTYPAYKGRRRWSDEEDERLLMLVARYGTQWAVIQRQDQICPASEGGSKLGNRTQVNMKDRARTLKKYYIRCGLPLPLNFDHVTG